MHNYDFYNIFAFAPFEFQQFACAMISIREGKEFQRFGVGKDGGIDGQYETENGNIILQVKNTKATGKALLTIARKEKKKIEECQCKRYIMVFSTLTISPGLKKEIKKLFPDVLSTNDILSAADLNAMLDEEKYEHLEKEYPQLWFGNGTFLEEMLSRNTISEIEKSGKVNEKRKEMEETEKKFVVTQKFTQAVELLEENGGLIISGDPGVGKTTHAYCLALYYLKAKDYKRFYFVKSLHEIERIMGENSEEKTIIFYDDFWGHSSFEVNHVEHNSDTRLMDIFAVLKGYTHIRLILTTREFVLQQGLRHYPELESEELALRRLCINLGSYTKAEKAEILFKHLEYSTLEYNYIRAIYKQREKIIDCEAYSPRSVDYYLKSHLVVEKPSEYAENFRKYVKNPQEYYEKIFKQISCGARWICILLALSENEIRVKYELKYGFMKIANFLQEKVDKECYEDYLKELDSTFTKMKEDDNEIVVDFLNYSICDYMKEYLKKNIAAYEDILVKGLTYYNQLFYLISEFSISEENRDIVLNMMMEKRKKMKFSYLENMDVDFYYEVEAPIDAYDEHKIWLLYRSYKMYGLLTLRDYLFHYCDELVDKMRKETITREEMRGVVNLFSEIIDCGYKVDVRELLELYYKNIKWIIDIENMQYLKVISEEIYTQFEKDHWEEIKQRIETLIYEDIDYYMDEPYWDAKIEDMILMLPDLLEYYGIPYTPEDEEDIKEYAGFYSPRDDKKWKVYKKEQVEIIRTMKENQLKEKAAYEAVEKEGKDRLQLEESYLTGSEIKEIEHENGVDYRKSYITKGKFTYEEFVLVMEYLRGIPQLPKTEESFYLGLTKYLLVDSNKIRYLEMLAKELIDKQMYPFSAHTLEKLENGVREKVDVEEYVERGILKYNGKWYGFWNDRYMYYLAYWHMQELTGEELQKYYQSLDFWDKLYEMEELQIGWFNFLHEKDEENLRQYVVVPVLEEYLKDLGNGGREKKIIKILENLELEISIDYENGEKGNLESLSCRDIPIISVFEFLSIDTVDELLDTCTIVLEGQAPETSEKEKIEIYLQDLLQSKTGIKTLKQYGCFDAADKVLQKMEQLIKTQEV